MPLLFPSFFVYRTKRLSLPLCALVPSVLLIGTLQLTQLIHLAPWDLPTEAEEPGLPLGMHNSPGRWIMQGA